MHMDEILADFSRVIRGGRNGLNLKEAISRIIFGFGLHAIIVYRFGKFIDNEIRSWYLAPIRIAGNLLYYSLNGMIKTFYGIHIDRKAVIGKGFKIGHFGDIFVGPCKIGNYCNIHQRVCIGEYGSAAGTNFKPKIGDYVWIGAHSTISKQACIESFSTVASGSVVRGSVRQGHRDGKSSPSYQDRFQQQAFNFSGRKASTNNRQTIELAFATSHERASQKAHFFVKTQSITLSDPFRHPGRR